MANQGLILDGYRDIQQLLQRVDARSDPEAIHEARVAIRRLRSLVADLAPALDEQGCRVLLNGLKHLSDELGVVRDTDVRAAILLPWLRDVQATKDDAHDASARLLEARLQTARRNARRRLRTRLRSAAFQQMQRDMDHRMGSGVTFRDGVDADALLQSVLQRRRASVQKAIGRKTGSSARRHALRIRVKKFRYLLDACEREPGGRRGEMLRARLRDLQDCLGELNDLAQARRWLKEQDTGTRTAKALRKHLRRRTRQLLERLDTLRNKRI